MALVCYIIPLVFALAMGIIVVEMALIDHSVWHQEHSLAFSLSLLEVPNVQGSV